MLKHDDIDQCLQLIANNLWDRDLFLRGEAAGVHLTPVHFYSPIPEVASLSNDIWAKPSSLTGIELNERCQLEFLNDICLKYKEEYSKFPQQPTSVPHQYFLDQMMFRSVDAEILYCTIRHFRPKKVVEVGSGFSTYVTAQALRMNSEDGVAGHLTAIEPYPNDVLRKGFPGLNVLRVEPVQKTDMSVFTQLQENDILFIDSSHVVRIGSDVSFLILEVLPRLKPGVVVHIHDIFLPAEYPKDWVVNEHRFWAEQYLLHAFLLFNSSFKVLWAGSFMHMKYSEALANAFPSYDEKSVWPGSFWLRRTR